MPAKATRFGQIWTDKVTFWSRALPGCFQLTGNRSARERSFRTRFINFRAPFESGMSGSSDSSCREIPYKDMIILTNVFPTDRGGDLPAEALPHAELRDPVRIRPEGSRNPLTRARDGSGEQVTQGRRYHPVSGDRPEDAIERDDRPQSSAPNVDLTDVVEPIRTHGLLGARKAHYAGPLQLRRVSHDR